MVAKLDPSGRLLWFHALPSCQQSAREISLLADRSAIVFGLWFSDSEPLDIRWFVSHLDEQGDDLSFSRMPRDVKAMAVYRERCVLAAALRDGPGAGQVVLELRAQPLR